MSSVKLDTESTSSTHPDAAESHESTAVTAPANSNLMYLDLIIPGYSTFAEAVSKLIGIDVSAFVRLGTFVFALQKFYDLLIRGPLQDFLNEHFYSSIRIRYTEELFDSLLAWYYEVISARNTRNQRVSNFWDSEDEDEREDRVNNAIDSQMTIFGLPASQTRTFDYSAWRADMPPPYEPDNGVYTFWYKGRYFNMTHARSTDHHRDSITLYVFGRSVEPLKALLQDVIRHSISKKAAHIRVHTSADVDSGSYWENSGLKPTRPMSTVILNEDQKKMIVDDINSFLHPLSQKWYRTRAIPYRRGYLFHGPPGTGKTSLSLALAGIFRFDLYTLHLNDPKLTEIGLAELFRCLPRRCIVLLEDIDDAGLKRESKSLTRRRNRKDKDDDNGPVGISMSGLLNVIDGVGSHEGRILIMTSNYPENLDEALLRSGRVDMKVQFTYATKSQVKALYMRVYEIDEGAGMIIGGALADAFFDSASATLGPLGEDDSSFPADPVERSRHRSKLANARLTELADQFAAKIPEEKIPPSDLQGYLLRYKTQPCEAVEDAEEFVKTSLENSERARQRRLEEQREREAELKRLLAEDEEEERKERAERRRARREVEGSNAGTPSGTTTPVPFTPYTPAFNVDVTTNGTGTISIPSTRTGLITPEPKHDSLFATPKGGRATPATTPVVGNSETPIETPLSG